MTKEEFIQKAKQKHGDKYDYSKVEIEKVKDKVTIICPKHGEFIQEANSHLQGRGCPYCSGRKFCLEDYINKANKVWNNKYDYSKFKWNGMNEKVCIICPEHGEFWQLPNNHLKGECGCLECRGKSKDFKKLNCLDDIIEASIKKFGDKFDFSKATYINSREKICIICPEHGEFWVLPYQFLQNKKGCPKCNLSNEGLCLRYSQEEFIELCKKNHPNIRYDYSKTKYVRSTDNIIVTCPKHGDFEMVANSFLYNGNCPKCNLEKLKLGKDKFIELAKEIHGDYYDYSKVEYENMYTSIIITCPKHGDFSQLPNNHLKGCNCPKCARENLISSKGEELISNILDKYNIKYKRQVELKLNKLARNTNILYIDFGIKLNNHIYFIEYNGKQHYEYIPFFFKTEEDFKKQLNRDTVLRDLCSLHKEKITLIEIKYDEPKEIIEQKLIKILNLKEYE